MLLKGNGREIVPAALSVSVRWNLGASPAPPWVSGADGDNDLPGIPSTVEASPLSPRNVLPLLLSPPLAFVF